MSEYWKSTPKYWCKHCKTFIRDTKLEKANHEATPKHQGNLKRFLRDLHRGHERDEKDKERAKSEVARLTGLATGGGGSGSIPGSVLGGLPPPAAGHPKPQRTAAEQKAQLAQLAQLGVSIPDEFRPDMAMAGEWQVTSERVYNPDEEKKPDSIALGVRKREIDDGEESARLTKKKWALAHGDDPFGDDDVDLDILLSNVMSKGKGRATTPIMKEEFKQEPGSVSVSDLDSASPLRQNTMLEPTPIKQELHREDDEALNNFPAIKPSSKQQTEPESIDVVFKKRKTKNIRQK